MLMRPRVIPCLLLHNRGLVKTVKFTNPTYLGDPINVVKIFNDKGVDEIFLLDITATVEGRGPSFDYLREIASESFVPLGYGGGVTTAEDIRRICYLGVEKVVINSYAVQDPAFVQRAAEQFGSSTIVISIDAKRDWRGRYQVLSHGGKKATGMDPVALAVRMASLGAGEILLSAIHRDGTMQGYDLELIRQVASSVDIPVVACGGAGGTADLVAAVRNGKASAVAAGSIFVFQGRHRAVLISYPSDQELRQAFAQD